ncbi:unnamed protein product [Rhizophagus irregularis]|uniref:Initiator tRNA phosphoribosyl transferase n=1 Tax=Rhizophagus irregularis TaxID=588596 RepID=A0A916E8U3_9GLOM|nr:initiator tRNA phosphoribosyl transferase [Rhizophagus irregularis DAOM 181602=DAOM 197198]CAB4490119.1 unnamed protein product [Rhizophagus irregularis]CAB5196957.1 unnamed protein product [Rhizophagus irregularis]CAB5369841.1 unnamed protein product [Rhizophagus irregularis]
MLLTNANNSNNDVDKITNIINIIGSNVHSDTEQIRKDSKNIFNRLKSIFEDAKFVSEISNLLPYLPVIANERCGTWYVDPTKFGTQTYNHKTWCIIVDSTRRGKRIPDSQSKTIPIWCCTINNAVKKFRDSITLDSKVSKLHKPPESIQQPNGEAYLTRNDELDDEWDTEFHSLPSLISKSEHNQIASLIPQFVQKLLNSGFDIQSLSNKLKKPLRPLWFTPSSNIFLHNLPDYTSMPFYPVICLSASKMVESGVERRKGFLYVQGSADDHEMWAKGLIPPLFWKYHEEILNTYNFIECEKIVSQFIQQERLLKLHNSELSNDSFNFVGNTNIAIGNYKSASPPECWMNFDYIINCTPEPYTSNENTPPFPYNKNYLQLPIPEEENKRILIHCKQGIDRSCGIALAIMIEYFDDKGNFIKNGVNHQIIRKEYIQNKLLYILSYRTKANPTKSTLKKINIYFMS